MLRKGDVTISGENVTIHKEIQVETLPVIQDALNKMEEDGVWEGQVTLSWSAMQRIRSLLITDEIMHGLAFYNLKNTIERKKAERDIGD